jgi:hypothetical protein
MATTTTSGISSPFRCDMSVIEPAQRKQHIATAVAVFHVVEEIHELPNGYAFRLPKDLREN